MIFDANRLGQGLYHLGAILTQPRPRRLAADVLVQCVAQGFYWRRIPGRRRQVRVHQVAEVSEYWQEDAEGVFRRRVPGGEERPRPRNEVVDGKRRVHFPTGEDPRVFLQGAPEGTFTLPKGNEK